MARKDKAPLQIDLDVPYRETISRLFIFRPLWVIVLIWVLMVWSLWMSIVGILQFFHSLILGRRHEGLWKRQKRFFIFVTRWNAYLLRIVDERPDFIE